MQISLRECGYVFFFLLTTIIVIFAWLRVSPRGVFWLAGLEKRRDSLEIPLRRQEERRGAKMKSAINKMAAF